MQLRVHLRGTLKILFRPADDSGAFYPGDVPLAGRQCTE